VPLKLTTLVAPGRAVTPSFGGTSHLVRHLKEGPCFNRQGLRYSNRRDWRLIIPPGDAATLGWKRDRWTTCEGDSGEGALAGAA
jgi:hypothetical protein